MIEYKCQKYYQIKSHMDTKLNIIRSTQIIQTLFKAMILIIFLTSLAFNGSTKFY